VKYEVFTAVTVKSALVRKDVSEELIASIIRVERTGRLGAASYC
jgi:demethoxyubiquinone hydroxylase (CLK1/Coq7/Cat5 family)